MTILVVGDAGLDVVVRHARPVVHGGDIKADIAPATGGAGANTAAWLAHRGASPILVTRVGDDQAGRQLAAELTARGVRCAFTIDPEAPTCCVVVLVDHTGQRSMLSDRGANARFHPADLDPRLLTGASHLHLSGYVLLDRSSRPAGLAVLAAARAAGLTTSVDPQAAPLLETSGITEFLDAVTGIDLLLPNNDELATLTGSPDPASAKALLDLVGAVAVTTGPSGATWIDRTGTWSVPAPNTQSIDTTGAGDAFNAGLLAAWLTGATPQAALSAGVTTGAQAVAKIGAQPP